MNDIIKQLTEDITKEAIQKTDKKETHKSYDTAGYGYQWLVDRFNDVLDNNWGFEWDIINDVTGKYKDKIYNGKTVPGKSYYDITVRLGIWIKNKDNIRYCVGGHIAINYSDALKGAITNAFKKTAAFWGVGAKAFRGQLDDDAILPESEGNKEDPPNKIELVKKSIVETMKKIKEIKPDDKDLDSARQEYKILLKKNNYKLYNDFLQKCIAKLNRLKKDETLKDKTGKDITERAAEIFDGEEIKSDDFVDDDPENDTLILRPTKYDPENPEIF